MHWLKAFCAPGTASRTEVCAPRTPPPPVGGGASLGDGAPEMRAEHFSLINADVGACPALSTMLDPVTQALGRLGGCTVIEATPGVPGAPLNWNPASAVVRGSDVVAGLM